jgi:carbon starvation protein
MFEALFILTTIDAGTRVGRYILQDFLGNIWKPLGDTSSVKANLAASALVVIGWGFFLIQGVRDPLGGINSHWPLFGIANQLLAAIALCLATTIILKKTMQKREIEHAKSSPAIALIVLLPLCWLLSVTMTAGLQKIFHPEPRIGFLSAVKDLDAKLPTLEAALTAAISETAKQAAQKEVRKNRTLRFNNQLDAYVAGSFLALVTLIVLISIKEWITLLSRRKLPLLAETEPVWLPERAVAEGGAKIPWWNVFALLFGLARELSNEAAIERDAKKTALTCPCDAHEKQSAEQRYVKVTNDRFNGIRRCC